MPPITLETVITHWEMTMSWPKDCKADTPPRARGDKLAAHYQMSWEAFQRLLPSSVTAIRSPGLGHSALISGELSQCLVLKERVETAGIGKMKQTSATAEKTHGNRSET